VCIVLLAQFTIKESIPQKSVMCTMEWYIFWSLACHVAFVSFICADDMCERDVAGGTCRRKGQLVAEPIYPT
jgi:hypothetical protein